ncbi:hypothetical protein AgCh_032762 [Apium graveolens]
MSFFFSETHTHTCPPPFVIIIPSCPSEGPKTHFSFSVFFTSFLYTLSDTILSTCTSFFLLIIPLVRLHFRSLLLKLFLISFQENSYPFPKMQIVTWVFKLLVIFSLFQLSLQAPPICSGADRGALLAFKARIYKDTTGMLASWVGMDCCDGGWEGIQCNPRTGRVTQVVLQRPADGDTGVFMKGTLSPSLGNLRFLEVMIISGMKRIAGNIPQSFSSLTRLTQLHLEDNVLEGSIPSSLGNLPFLKALSLSGNHLTGPIPPTFGNFRNLVQLTVARNHLQGPIPISLKNLFSLQYLDLSHNSLSGFIPDFVGQFKNLTFLDLSNNQISGGIPISLGSLASLSDMSLSQNQLAGSIPSEIGHLKSLTSLSLSMNQLSGQIPDTLSQLQNLWHLNLSRNALSNPLPDAFSKGIPSLLSIDLSYNHLNLGTVPEWIRSRELSDVHLAGCNLIGTLPVFAKPNSLNSVDLSDNHFTNGISDFFSKMSSLQKAKLSNNQLKSDLSTITLPTGLASLDLHSNQLFGSLSGILNRTSNFMQAMDLSNNYISGSIPEFSEGSSLTLLNVGSNKITGQIPDSISNLATLERLDISRNQVTGTIPTSLGLLFKLQWLDLSINKLVGKIPLSLLDIEKLRHANFRANKLCGMIPQGRPFNAFPSTAYGHNLCLCGKPLPPCKGMDNER